MEQDVDASHSANLGEIAQQLAQLAAALRILKDQPIDGTRLVLDAPPADDDADPVVEG